MSTPRSTLLALALSLPAVVSAPAMLAAESGITRTEFDARIVDEILVVGARLSRPVSDVVGTVDVITREQLLADLTTDVHDFVRYIPGVSVNQPDSRFGGTEFVIRGLGGNRVVTLIDGVPLADQFDVGSYANAGQDYLIADAISRIELLRGPASTLFGTDALGGVVAVVTRDPEEMLQGAASRMSGSAAYGGADDSLTLSAALAGRVDRVSGLLHVSRLDGNERAHNAGARDPQDRMRHSAMAKFNYRLDSGDLLRVKADLFEEEVDTEIRAVLGSGRFINTTQLLGDDTRRRHGVTVGYEFDREIGWADRGVINAFAQRTQVDQRTDETREIADPPLEIFRRFEYEYGSIGATTDFERQFDLWGAGHRLGWGVSLAQADIEQSRDGVQTNLSTGSAAATILGETFPLRDFPRSTTRKYAAYVHNEIRAGNVTLIPALRYEVHRLRANADALYTDSPGTEPANVNESALAPKFGVIWDQSETLSWYAQYARGFRAPPFQDVNIGLDIPQFNIRAIPNPDLRAETSDGVELGLRVRTPMWYAAIAVFGADYDDLIESRVNLGPDPASGTVLFQSQNIEQARIYGAELSMRLWLDDWVPGLELHTVAVWARGENRQTGLPLNSVDPMEAVARLFWRQSERVRLGLHITAVASPTRVDETRTPLFVPSGYALVDLTAAWNVTERLRIDAGIFNLFDREYWRWASVRHRPDGDPTLAVLTGPARHASVALRLAL
jgi:hemoglobin/transferrin/lactoferrin receptor protein